MNPLQPCESHQCFDGTIRTMIQSCARPQCSNPIQVPGQCCPVCPVDCSLVLCARPVCPTGVPVITPPGQCCPRCDVSTSTSAATTSATGSVTCPSNCGQRENGGGTCRPSNLKCLSCNFDRLRSNGRCFRSLSCRGRRVQGGSAGGDGCRCLDDNCHYCNRNATGDVCRVCRNGFYHLNGACVASCPVHMTSSGINTFKRRCLPPHTCQSGRILEFEFNFGCKCATENNTLASCHICEHRAGAFGQHCLRCKGAKFLYQNECREDCSGLNGVIEYTPSSFGRECRPSFTCRNNQDANGVPCKCSRDLRLAGCNACRWDENGATCLD